MSRSLLRTDVLTFAVNVLQKEIDMGRVVFGEGDLARMRLRKGPVEGGPEPITPGRDNHLVNLLPVSLCLRRDAGHWPSKSDRRTQWWHPPDCPT